MNRSSPWISKKASTHTLGVLLAAISAIYCYMDFFQPYEASVSITKPIIFNSDSTSQHMTRWLEPGDIQLNIELLGIIHHSGNEVALVRVNNQASQAYTAGDLLAPELRLSQIAPHAITITHHQRSYTISLEPTTIQEGVLLRSVSKDQLTN
ncbi:hypothetical protein [Alcaligenes endophyticus]|uniref:Type II secretion system protein GspC N-terminal domain-containing protein n=1 Tax=Alcaligenes endophyticus TaxID=1929088 RepID=A0ABT8EKE4_9BURK|nr:hypothetical protein [Alcaligenes endophyticus]MCX5590870.1 hypothetical protein [Alcaligenes endophyticus]MDN4121767.1 hypothetical protein [Alcaligenes endophyticus]